MNDLTQEWIRTLEAEWQKPDGFLGKTREGIFDEQAGATFAAKLENIELPPGTTIDRRLVALLWYIPNFLDWQKERVKERGGNSAGLEQLRNRVQGLIEQVLGVP